MISKDSKLRYKYKKLLLKGGKNSKGLFYLKNFLKFTIPQAWYKPLLKHLIDEENIINKDYVFSRVGYYNKIEGSFVLKDFTTVKKFKFRHEHSIYFFDTYGLTKYFDYKEKFAYVFGDVVEIPKEPAFVKSRPISAGEENCKSVLLKLNKIRHYKFVKDKIKFVNKKDQLIWRGDVTDTKLKRIKFLEKHFSNEKCDLGVSSRKYRRKEWIKDILPIKDQLKYKFIGSIEGHDVATNLKWIMSSNSIAVMPKPEFETWFMEGTLIPDYHYICIKDDFSDLNEKLDYYINNPDEALKIIKNANDYTRQFQNNKQEKLISLLVMNKYFNLSN